MNEKQENTKEKKKGRNGMAILTAECDRAFVVSADKAEQFKEQKKNEKIFKKIESVTAKFEKNLKVDRK